MAHVSMDNWHCLILMYDCSARRFTPFHLRPPRAIKHQNTSGNRVIPPPVNVEVLGGRQTSEAPDRSIHRVQIFSPRRSRPKAPYDSAQIAADSPVQQTYVKWRSPTFGLLIPFPGFNAKAPGCSIFAGVLVTS